MNRSVALIIVFASSTALAQPSAQPPVASDQPPPVIVVTPAPQNEDWNNVSHINGHPVKVGERSDYLYKWKTTNISTNPIGWIFGFYGLSIEQALTTNVAIRGDANFFSFDQVSGYEFGASAPIYLKRVYQGPFLEPGVIVRGIRDTYLDDFCDVDCTDMNTSTFVGPEVLFGWHWTFDSGLNVAMAFGGARGVNRADDGDNIQPAGYFRVGYAF